MPALLPAFGTSSTYDKNARLLKTALPTSGSSVLNSAAYGYNAASQRLTFTNASNLRVNYTYDPIGQLTAANSSDNDYDGYAYDPAWNLNQRTNNGVVTTFSVNHLNELTGGPDGTCGWDWNGNLTQMGIRTNTYDCPKAELSLSRRGVDWILAGRSRRDVPPAESGRNECPTFTRRIAPRDAARTAQRAVPTGNSAWMRLPATLRRAACR